jgi:hypothetical protein
VTSQAVQGSGAMIQHIATKRRPALGGARVRLGMTGDGGQALQRVVLCSVI